MKKILSVFGTRPEAIKMSPLVKEFANHPNHFLHKICVTAQHREMLDQVLELYNIKPDYDLNTMTQGQSLTEITSKVLVEMEPILKDFNPDAILVHGDTTTTMAASLAGFYQKIPIGHVEAGLRTGNIYAPWPEEVNRSIAGVISSFHFAPTEGAKQNLIKAGALESTVIVTGNTVIDSLLNVVKIINNDQTKRDELSSLFPFLDSEKKMILVTCHRRENFGDGIQNVCNALRQIANLKNDVQIVYPVHLNPNIKDPVFKALDNIENIYLIQPQDYLPFVYLMSQAEIIITDSGGIQEEAPSLDKPVLVLRGETERPEAVEAGTVKLIGTNTDLILSEVEKLLNNEKYLNSFKDVLNPYGDGNASQRIVEFLKSAL